MKDLIQLLKGFWNFSLKRIRSVCGYMLSTHCVPSAVIRAGDTSVMTRQMGFLPDRTCHPAKKKPLLK